MSDDQPWMSIKRSSAFAVVALSVAFASYDGWLQALGEVPTEHLYALYQFLFSILLATWLVTDIRLRGRSLPSFDSGWFVWAVLPAFVPYHLISTRRWRGVLVCLGMLLLYLLPWFAELIAWNFS